MGLFRVDGRVDWLRLVASVLLAEGVGALSGFLSGGGMEAYRKLVQPPFAPPGWVFAVVWPILYLLMGIASYRVWMRADNPRTRSRANAGLTLYAVQLTLNFFWSLIFFGGLRGFAFLWVVALWSMIVATTVQFSKVDRTASLLMYPYIIWVTFASILNFSVWQLNMGT